MKDIKVSIRKKISAAEFKKIKWEEAKYPLFEIENAYIRSQVAVCIGCDVLVGGIKGCRWIIFVIKMEIVREKLQKEMTLWMQSQLNLPEQAVDTFCKAFICEPCNESSDCCEVFCYIWKLKSLPTYLKEFLNVKKTKCNKERRAKKKFN